MQKKYIISGIMILFFVISGVCYSCAYSDRQTSTVLLSKKTKEESGDALASTKQEASEDPTSQDSGHDNDPANKEADLPPSIAADIKSKEDMIYIHICGAVVNPDVYQVWSGARLIDVLELCGGLSGDADGDYINQAAKVLDGQRIYIPTKQEAKELSPEEYMKGDAGSVMNQTEEQGLININTAGVQELMDLPGIGQAKADSIIAYRNKTGEFERIEDLMNIPGIKEGLFNQISSYITIQ